MKILVNMVSAILFSSIGAINLVKSRKEIKVQKTNTFNCAAKNKPHPYKKDLGGGEDAWLATPNLLVVADGNVFDHWDEHGENLGRYSK